MNTTLQATLEGVTRKKISEAAEDSLANAQIKWHVRLTEEEKKIVLANAFDQLTTHVNQGIGDRSWKIGDSMFIPVLQVNPDVELKYVRRHNSKIVAVYVESEDELPPDAFDKHLINAKMTAWIYQWLDTAIYYCVASLA